jgi:hypothetical protein
MSDTIKVSKRGRGRPKGTGKPDQATLQQVAELLLDNPGMRHTAAIKRIIGGANPSAIRRLQVRLHLDFARSNRWQHLFGCEPNAVIV